MAVDGVGSQHQGPAAQRHHPREVVGSASDIGGHLRARSASEPGAAEPADGLEPPEDLFDAFADALTDSITRCLRRASVNGRAPGTFQVLHDMRGHVAHATGLDEGGIVISLVGGNRDAPCARDVVFCRVSVSTKPHYPSQDIYVCRTTNLASPIRICCAPARRSITAPAPRTPNLANCCRTRCVHKFKSCTPSIASS